MLFDFIFRQLRPLIFSGDAETAHERMLTIVESISKFPGLIPLLRRQFMEEHSVLRTQLFGRSLQNPIGLAAGFDKDGRIHPALFALGFGFVEIGTVTPYPQAGNPRPRLFRLPEDEALINRLGFNNHGASEMAELLVSTLKRFIPKDTDIIELNSNLTANIASGMLGINIGKNKDTLLEKASDDYVSCLSMLHPYADYFTLNISSPNTEDLRNLQEKDALRVLLDSVCACRDKLDQNHSRKTPLLVKLSPDLDETALGSSIRVMKEFFNSRSDSRQHDCETSGTEKQTAKRKRRPERKTAAETQHGNDKKCFSEIRNRNADYRCGWDFQWSRCI